MVNGAPTGPDSGFDVNEPAYVADVRAAESRTELPVHRMAPSSSVHSTINPSLNTVRFPHFPPAPNTSDTLATAVADTTIEVLEKPSSVTQADIDALVVGDTVVSNSGTKREIIAIN